MAVGSTAALSAFKSAEELLGKSFYDVIERKTFDSVGIRANSDEFSCKVAVTELRSAEVVYYLVQLLEV